MFAVAKNIDNPNGFDKLPGNTFCHFHVLPNPNIRGHRLDSLAMNSANFQKVLDEFRKQHFGCSEASPGDNPQSPGESPGDSLKSPGESPGDSFTISW